MTKAEIVSEVAKATGVEKTAVQTVVDQFFQLFIRIVPRQVHFRREIFIDNINNMPAVHR